LTLISGSNTITTRATDTSNNIKETSITLTYTLSVTTPPAISAISSSNITSSSATISWNTNEASNTQVEYGTTTSYGSSTTLYTNLVTSHSQSLSGLSASTLYHYRVKSKDPSGNLATSGDYTFTTVSVPSGPLKLTIDHTKIDAPLSDFPVLIHLGKSSGINSADTSFVLASLGTDANRKKISVTTASGTQLYVEIEKWDSANKEAWLWVKVPSISNTQDTVLYLNYDPSMADNTAMVGDTRSTPAENVWSNGFVMVQHFEQSGSGNTGEFLDSTKRHHNGQGGEGSSSGTPVKVASNIGYGQSFDGISDFISVPDSDDFSVTTTCQFTFSVWINLGAQNFNSSDSYIRWIGKGDNSGNWEWHSVLYNQNANDPDRLRQYDYGPTGGLGAGDYSTSSFAVGQWRHITGVNTCSDASHGNEWLYVDGVHTGLPQTWQTYGFTYANGVAPLRIGNARGFNGKDWFNGKMDEVRISNVSRSQAWIKAEYYADSDALLS
jgi:hypothetical protein